MNSQPVLYVEDAANDRLLMEQAFAEAGTDLRLFNVKNAEQALAWLAGAAPYEDRQAWPLPAVVLLDLKLPGMNGLELLRWLRRQPEPLRTLPVVLFTTSVQETDVRQAYEAGANSFLSKPLGFRRLVAIVQMLAECLKGTPHCWEKLTELEESRAAE